MEIGLGDQKLASMRDKLKLLKPLYCCPSKNRVAFICQNEKCDRALFCSDQNCGACFERHEACGGKSYNISYLTNKLNKLSNLTKEMIDGVELIDNKFIESINRGFERFVVECPLHVLDKQNQVFVDKIYKHEGGENISGNLASKACKKIDKKMKNTQAKMTQKLAQYKKKMEYLIEQAQTFKKELKRCLEETKIELDSSILKSSQDEDKIEFLIKCLSQKRAVKTLNLLYRGSRDGFSVNKFHQKCDDKEDTVTIVRTEFNKTIAGYTHYKWDRAKKDQPVGDVNRRAFLLQLDAKQKYLPMDQNNIITNYQAQGPTFGADDLNIKDQCNITNSSTCNFPTSYNLQGPNKYQNSQATYTKISGAVNGANFRVADYEVFQVIFE